MFNVSVDFDLNETAEIGVFADHEVICPFCECNYLSIAHDEVSTTYKCANCGGEWDVLEK